MKDLMEYLGHHRRPRVWRRRVVFEGYLELRYSSAGMWPEKSKQMRKCYYARKTEDENNEQDTEKDHEGPSGAQRCSQHRE